MDIVYFGNEWYAENRTSSHHIARRLPGYGRVLYVDSPGARAPRASRRDLRRLFRKLGQTVRKPVEVEPGLWHCTVPQIPFTRIPGVARLNRWFGRFAVSRAIRAIEFQRYVSWFVVPHPGFLAGQLGEDLVVYYCIDDYAAHPGADVLAMEAADDSLARRCDLLFVAPPALVPQKLAQNPSATYSPHGVDFDLFSQASESRTPVPELGATLQRPVIGFFGLLADWIDVPLIAQVAARRPDWTLLLIGHASTDVAELVDKPNVLMVGPKPYEQLPSWAKLFDVAIMPYRQNRQVKNANPLKLREYLATGKPVVSVPTPEVEKFVPHVYLADSPDEFVTAIDRALVEDGDDLRRSRMQFVRPMSWDARVQQVMERVQAKLARATASSFPNRAGH